MRAVRREDCSSGDDMRPAIWIAVLRPYMDGILIEGVLSLEEVQASHLDLRMRYNPELRLVPLRLPPNTSRDQVLDAFSHLTDDERQKLYNMKQRPMVDHR